MIIFLSLHNIILHGFMLLLRQVLLVSSVEFDIARVVVTVVHHQLERLHDCSDVFFIKLENRLIKALRVNLVVE